MTSETASFELPVRVVLKPSRWVVSFIYLSHLGAVVCMSLSGLPVLSILVICLGLLISLACCHVTYIYKLNKDSAELVLNDKDEWYLCDDRNGRSPVVLLPESYVHEHLLILMFKQNRRKRVIIFSSDNIPRNIFRRLRVRLRYKLSGAGVRQE